MAKRKPKTVEIRQEWLADYEQYARDARMALRRLLNGDTR
jgi:hypothetical protein